MEEQQDKAWTAQEIAVEKDIHDYRHVMAPNQLNLVTITLQIFVEIEQKVGEVWEQIARWYPHSEIEGCCAEIARMEKSVHAFFYQKMSDVLNIDPEDTARNQATIQVLKKKLEFLTKITSNMEVNKPLALATVAAIEQVLLFSNFAMLKSFQANGNNLISTTTTGVDFVVQDETLHGTFASYLFKTVLDEDSKIKSIDKQQLESDIYAVMAEIIEHEDAVIDYTFSGSEKINDVSGADLKMFIRSRANEVLDMLDIGTQRHTLLENPIAEWFYKGANSIKMHDFFVSGTSQYRRAWSLDGFSRIPHMKVDTGEQDYIHEGDA